MRATAGMLLVGLLMCASAGCSSGRWSLAKSDAPKPAPGNDDVRVKYGNPWGKSTDKVAGNTPAKPNELPPEFAAQLADARARNARGGDIAETLKLAAEAEQKGDFGTAKSLYQKVLDRDPRHGEAHHRLGVIADQQQDQRAADQHYMQALAVNRKDADLLSDIGYSYYLRGRLEESERYLKDAVEVNSYHRTATAHLGQVYVKQGKYDAALAMFRQVATENEAQRMIAQAFPNGRPAAGGTQSLANDFRAGPGFNDSSSPRANPANGIPVWANSPVQQSNATANSGPQGTALEQIADALQPSITPGVPANSGQPASQATQTTTMMPPISTPPAATVPPTTFNGASPQPANSASPTTQNNPPYWNGALRDGSNAPAANAIANVPPPMAFDASRIPSPSISAQQFPSGNPAWNAAPAMSAPNPGAWNAADFQPASYENRAPAATNPWPSNLGPTTTNNMNPNDAARWAAQMAMNSGPGAMFPVVTPGPATQTVMQAGATGNAQGGVRWAYGEQATGTANKVQNAVGWSDRMSADSDVQPSAWQSNLAPPSPWNDWQPPAPPSRNWTTPQDFGAQNAAPPQPLNNPNPAANAGPTPWPNGPAAQSTPANDPRYQTGAPPATTISNWPYAPTRQ